jgi:hypothetical protein
MKDLDCKMAILESKLQDLKYEKVDVNADVGSRPLKYQYLKHV